MPRKGKSSASASTESAATAAAPAATAKTVSKKASKKAAAPAAETAPVAVVAETVPATDAAAASTESSTWEAASERFTEFASQLTALTSQLSALKNSFRALEKQSLRDLRVAQKASAKKKRKNGNRQPSGFVKPTKISNELAAFLGRDAGTEMARTDVTREINKYIRAHNLQDAQNGRKINPDKSLRTLLKIPSGEELTYFNLQRYMSPHFAKMSQQTQA